MTELYADVVGQPRAVQELRAAARAPVHAYLLVGPPGTGKLAAARSFAASLLCPRGGCGQCEDCRRALAGVHPDVVVQERQGASILVDDARAIARLAARSPVEGRRKVLLLNEFHLVDKAAPALLKTIEEPAETAVFVILAEHVPPELVTIASRCCRIDFGAIPADALRQVLMADGVSEDVADEAATAAGGRLDRARLLASDPGFADRRRLWASVPDRLDGTGAAVAAVVDDLIAAVDAVVEPVKARQAAGRAEAEAVAERYGQRPPARKELETQERREQRRVRMDELRSGLAVLSARYRDRLASTDVGTGPQEALAALDAIATVVEGLAFNPNETLLLQGLFTRLTVPSRNS